VSSVVVLSVVVVGCAVVCTVVVARLVVVSSVTVVITVFRNAPFYRSFNLRKFSKIVIIQQYSLKITFQLEPRLLLLYISLERQARKNKNNTAKHNKPEGTQSMCHIVYFHGK